MARPTHAPKPAAEGSFASIVERGRREHADLDLDPAAFARFLSNAGQPGAAEGVDGVLAEDLFLACACAVGAPGAAARFEALHGRTIERSVARVLLDRQVRDDAAQRTRHLLLVGDAPKIATYRGRAPLGRWVSVVALRVAVSTGRAESAERRLRDKMIAVTISGDDPESEAMVGESREKVEHAITEALGQLDHRDRLILRLHFVGGMSVRTLAGMLHLDHSTVVRRIRRVCEGLLNVIASSLQQAGIATSSLRSLVGLLESRLHISVSRLLGAE